MKYHKYFTTVFLRYDWLNSISVKEAKSHGPLHSLVTHKHTHTRNLTSFQKPNAIETDLFT